MGNSYFVGYNTFPKQGIHLNKRVNVCFYYDTHNTISGKIIRNDISEPYLGIILLDDGRAVLTRECQYSIIGD